MPVALGATPITNIRLGSSVVSNIYLGTARVWAPLPVVTSTSIFHIVNTPFSYQIQGTNAPTSYSASNLPTGLSVDSLTGIISGTPTVEGTTTVSIFATNPGGVGSGTLVITVGPPPPVVNDPDFGVITVGVPYSFQITLFSGGPASYFNANVDFPILSSSTGTLPPGLSVNTSTGLISGTPTQAGSYLVFVSAGNVSGGTWEFSFMTVDPAPPPPTSP